MEVGNRSCYPSCDLCTITTCSPPLREKPQFMCEAYFPKIPPIRAIRLAEPVNAMRGCAEWTNLAYRSIVQGGLRYYGVDKLIPYGPPPSSPVLCRPAPIKPINPSSMIVYSAP